MADEMKEPNWEFGENGHLVPGFDDVSAKDATSLVMRFIDYVYAETQDEEKPLQALALLAGVSTGLLGHLINVHGGGCPGCTLRASQIITAANQTTVACLKRTPDPTDEVKNGAR